MVRSPPRRKEDFESPSVRNPSPKRSGGGEPEKPKGDWVLEEIPARQKTDATARSRGRAEVPSGSQLQDESAPSVASRNFLPKEAPFLEILPEEFRPGEISSAHVRSMTKLTRETAKDVYKGDFVLSERSSGTHLEILHVPEYLMEMARRNPYIALGGLKNERQILARDLYVEAGLDIEIDLPEASFRDIKRALRLAYLACQRSRYPAVITQEGELRVYQATSLLWDRAVEELRQRTGRRLSKGQLRAVKRNEQSEDDPSFLEAISIFSRFLPARDQGFESYDQLCQSTLVTVLGSYRDRAREEKGDIFEHIADQSRLPLLLGLRPIGISSWESRQLSDPRGEIERRTGQRISPDVFTFALDAPIPIYSTSGVIPGATQKLLPFCDLVFKMGRWKQGYSVVSRSGVWIIYSGQAISEFCEGIKGGKELRQAIWSDDQVSIEATLRRLERRHSADKASQVTYKRLLERLSANRAALATILKTQIVLKEIRQACGLGRSYTEEFFELLRVTRRSDSISEMLRRLSQQGDELSSISHPVYEREDLKTEGGQRLMLRYESEEITLRRFLALQQLLTFAKRVAEVDRGAIDYKQSFLESWKNYDRKDIVFCPSGLHRVERLLNEYTIEELYLQRRNEDLTDVFPLASPHLNSARLEGSRRIGGFLLWFSQSEADSVLEGIPLPRNMREVSLETVGLYSVQDRFDLSGEQLSLLAVQNIAGARGIRGGVRYAQSQIRKIEFEIEEDDGRTEKGAMLFSYILGCKECFEHRVEGREYNLEFPAVFSCDPICQNGKLRWPSTASVSLSICASMQKEFLKVLFEEKEFAGNEKSCNSKKQKLNRERWSNAECKDIHPSEMTSTSFDAKAATTTMNQYLQVERVRGLLKKHNDAGRYFRRWQKDPKFPEEPVFDWTVGGRFPGMDFETFISHMPAEADVYMASKNLKSQKRPLSAILRQGGIGTRRNRFKKNGLSRAVNLGEGEEYAPKFIEEERNRHDNRERIRKEQRYTSVAHFVRNKG